MKIWLYMLIFPVFLLHHRPLFAQRAQQHYEVYNTRTGLPNNAVLSMVQDDAGLLWIGTRNGLCVYDGHSFETLTNPFATRETEWENIFWQLFKDKKGSIWVSTQAGRVGTFSNIDGQFTSIETNGLLEGEFITAFFQCNDHVLVLGSNNGNIYTVNIEGYQMKKVAAVPEGIQSIEAGKNGSMRLNMKTEIRLPGLVIAKTCQSQISIAIEPNGCVNIQRKGTTAIIKENEILSKRNYVLSVSEDRLVLATTRLVKEFDLDGHMCTDLVVNNEPGVDNEDVANFIFNDKSGLLWLGTNAGLIKINKAKYRFTNFGTDIQSGKLNSNYVRSVMVDAEKNVWVGFKAGHVNRVARNKTTEKVTTTSCPPASYPSTQAAVNVIRQMRSGTILLGGTEGLFYISKNETRSRQPTLRTFSRGSPFYDKRILEVWTICESRAGKLWVGTRGNGLFVIDPRTRERRHYAYTETGGLASVWQVFEDHSGNIWLCTQNGLDSVCMDQYGYPSSFYNLHNHYAGRPGKHVWSVVEDDQNRLWIGTTDNGLSMVDKDRQAFITFNQQDGLPGSAVCGLLRDDANCLWISSMNGITCFDIASRKVRHFTESDGLPGNDFNFNACYSTSDGKMLFGSKNGLTMFYPNTLKSQPPAAPPVVLRIGNKDGEIRPVPETLFLTHQNNSIDVRFSISEYSKSGNNRYKYMLEGFDEHWLTTDARHPYANYTNIPPGNYVLLVSGDRDEQTWQTGITRMNVIVQHAFWQLPSFIFLCAASGLSLLAWFLYRQFRRITRKEKEKNDIDRKFAQLELRALQAQMNPHFVFNAINAVQHFMLCNDELSANAYLSKFARLMRLYFESSHKKYMLLGEEIELLRLYVCLEKLRFEDKFDYEFFIEPEIEHASLEIPSMLLQPFVENAINHGLAQRHTPGRLNIHFSLVNSCLVCIIDDDGVGRDNADHKASATKKRHTSSDAIDERLAVFKHADNIRVTISITDKKDLKGNNAGTTVKLEIPKLI